MDQHSDLTCCQSGSLLSVWPHFAKPRWQSESTLHKDMIRKLPLVPHARYRTGGHTADTHLAPLRKGTRAAHQRASNPALCIFHAALAVLLEPVAKLKSGKLCCQQAPEQRPCQDKQWACGHVYDLPALKLLLFYQCAVCQCASFHRLLQV